MKHYWRVSKKGERKVNEDRVGLFKGPNLRCYMVADGLGGHGFGDKASELVRRTIKAIIENSEPDVAPKTLLCRCFDEAQAAVLAEQQSHGLQNSMKTTLVVLIIKDGYAYWGHIGDSRLYLFSRHRYLQRTSDHSVPQMLVNSGRIKESEIRHHPDRNRLLRVIGVDWDGEREYDINEAGRKIKRGDSFVLCSDGFWEWIDEKTMLQILKKKKIEKKAAAMEKIVLQNGKGHNMDNYSAIVVKF